jgi:hypothetical protein
MGVGYGNRNGMLASEIMKLEVTPGYEKAVRS